MSEIVKRQHFPIQIWRQWQSERVRIVRMRLPACSFI